MRSPKLMSLAVLIILVSIFTLTSCATKTPDAPTTNDDPAATQPKDADKGDADDSSVSDQNIDEEDERARLEKEAFESAKLKFEDVTIHFDFGSWVILPSAMDILKVDAAFLNANPDLTVVVEGHCDTRGTTEYNMALGDRRAQSAKSVLVDLGVDAGRINTVSYGEEKPVAFGDTAADHAKNRRCAFRLN